MAPERVTKRTLAKKVTYTKVFEGARSCFTKTGYEKTTIRGVAKSVGMSTGAIFANFKDKEALLAAVLREECGEYRALRKKLLQSDTISERELAIELLSADYRHDRLSLLRAQVSLAFGGSALVGQTLEERAAFLQSFFTTAGFSTVWAAHLYICRPQTGIELTPDALKLELVSNLESIGLGTQE